MNEEYIKGFIEGFMITYEGFNGEYGSLNDFNWNGLNKEEAETLKIKLREHLENGKKWMS